MLTKENLHLICQRKHSFIWTNLCEEDAFVSLKQNLITASILDYPAWTEYIMDTDASFFSIR